MLNTTNMKPVDIPGVQSNRYYISNQGVVYDSKSNRILRYYVDKDGYFMVSIVTDTGRRRIIAVHRLVAYAFCKNPNPEICNTVNHIDGQKIFNFDSNLEWVSSGDNTRHADRIGLRNVRGDHNGHSRYSEAFVRKMCSMYEQGMNVIDVYHVLFGEGPITTQTQRGAYMFCWRIKRKEAWLDVVKEYDYSTDTNSGDPRVKQFMPTENSTFNEDTVRWICERFVEGHSTADVYEMLKNGRGPQPLKQGPQRQTIITALGKIRHGTAWRYITRDYDMPELPDRVIERPDVYNESFRVLIDKGYTKSKIIETVATNFGKSQSWIGACLRKYLKDNGIG